MLAGALLHDLGKIVELSGPAVTTYTTEGQLLGHISIGFSMLKEECDRLNSIGAFFMVSNSNSKFIKELYKDYKIIVIPAKRCINSKGNKRKNSTEVIIINY